MNYGSGKDSVPCKFAEKTAAILLAFLSEALPL
jgi:hypothetical protein